MNKKKLFTIIILVILIVIGGGSIWYIMNGGQNTTDGKDANTYDSKPTTTSDKDIYSFISSDPKLSNFNKLLITTGLSDTLKVTSTKYIVMAPNNDAFKMLPNGYYDSLLTSAKIASAQDITKYHIAIATTDNLTDKQKLKTLQGQEVIVNISGGRYYFTSAKGDKASTVKTPQKTANGTLYVIDKVLLPQ